MAFQINYIWIKMNVFGFGRLIDSSRYCSCIVISQVERICYKNKDEPKEVHQQANKKLFRAGLIFVPFGTEVWGSISLELVCAHYWETVGD